MLVHIIHQECQVRGDLEGHQEAWLECLHTSEGLDMLHNICTCLGAKTLGTATLVVKQRMCSPLHSLEMAGFT